MEKQIYQRIANINKKINAIGKKSKNISQNFMFRGIDDIMNELHSLFVEEEVFILQNVKEYDIKEVNTRSGGVLTYTRAKIDFIYTTIDGSSIMTSNVGEAMDTGDKGMNKAMSIALKYSLLQLFLIPTKEEKDPDTISHEIISKKDDNLLIAIQEAKESKNIEELKKVWERWVCFQSDAIFKKEVSLLNSTLKQNA